MKPSKYIVTVNGQEVCLDIPNDLILSADTLVEDLASQPSLLAYYGQVKSDALYEQNCIEAKLDLVIAAARSDVRSANLDKKKLTVSEIDDKVALMDEVMEMRDELRKAEYLTDRVTAAYEAVKERGKSLYSTAQVYKSELLINDEFLTRRVNNIRQTNNRPVV